MAAFFGADRPHPPGQQRVHLAHVATERDRRAVEGSSFRREARHAPDRWARLLPAMLAVGGGFGVAGTVAKGRRDQRTVAAVTDLRLRGARCSAFWAGRRSPSCWRSRFARPARRSGRSFCTSSSSRCWGRRRGPSADRGGHRPVRSKLRLQVAVGAGSLRRRRAQARADAPDRYALVCDCRERVCRGLSADGVRALPGGAT